MLRDPDLNLSPMAGDPVSLTADRWLRNKETVSLLSADWKVLHTRAIRQAASAII